MDGHALRDRIYRGMGVAARKLGAPFTVYRPSGAGDPLASANRIIRLYASFNAEDNTYRRVLGYGHAVWWGIFDASYTQPGDYLIGEADSYFVCSQPAALPVQCVKTNRTVSVLRAPAPVSGGYGGLVAENAVPIVTGWPANVLAASARVEVGAAETRFGGWTVLLPVTAACIRVSDTVVDDVGTSYVVGSAEQSDLGWRVRVRQLAT